MSIVMGEAGFIFGQCPVKPIINAPKDARIRIRLRCDDFVTVFVRPKQGGIEKWYVKDIGDYWRLSFQQGANVVI